MPPKPPVTEWVFNDSESMRKAIDGARRMRRMNWEDISRYIGNRLISAFMRGESKGLYTGSLFKVAEAMKCEIVLRPRSKDAMQERLDALRDKRDNGPAEDEAAEV